MKHGKWNTKEHSIWRGMLNRCSNHKNKGYKNYGGRGIIVCERWMEFKNFFADMGEKPEGKSLDRINNNGNYEPSNCRWATQKEQMNNTRTNRLIRFNYEVKSLSEWAQEYNIDFHTLRCRLENGWHIGKALLIPPEKRGTSAAKAAKARAITNRF